MSSLPRDRLNEGDLLEEKDEMEAEVCLGSIGLTSPPGKTMSFSGLPGARAGIPVLQIVKLGAPVGRVSKVDEL